MDTTYWTQLAHNGYGSTYNTLFVSPCKTLLLKRTNEKGLSKLLAEKEFYSFVHNNDLPFPIPRVTNTDNSNEMYMEYLNGYVPLYKIWDHLSHEDRTGIFAQIQTHLDRLHDSKSKLITREELWRHVYTEVNEKVRARFQDVKGLIEQYKHVKYVNDIKITSFEEAFDRLQRKFEDYFKNHPEVVALCPIHGDPQFHNIMVHEDTRDIVFIDPRGYFGNSTVFGRREYDDAKLLFALTGYDAFDEKVVTELNIANDTIYIDIPLYLPEIVRDPKNKLARLFMISIWLANAHSFASLNPLKAVHSYFIALYIDRVFFE